MRAAVIYEHGPLDRIILEDDYPDPEPQAGWVRLRVRACSLNYRDIFSRRGMPLEEVREAERLMEDREISGKIVITP